MSDDVERALRGRGGRPQKPALDLDADAAAAVELAAEAAGQGPSFAPGAPLAGALTSALVAVLVLLFVHHAVAVLRNPLPVEYGEGTVLNYVRLLGERGEYALPIDAEPWVHATYPPLVPYLGLAVSRLCGVTFLATRVVHLVALLGALALMLRLLRGARLGWRATALAGGLFLAIPWVHGWAPLGRVDAVAVALSLASLAAFLREPTGRGAAWAAPLAGLALLAKPTALAAPAAIAFWLLVRRRPGRAALFAAIAALVAGAGFLAWNQASGGQAWLHMTRYAAVAGYSPARTLRHALGFARVLAVLLPVALVASLRRPLGVLPLWLGFSLAGLLWMGKPGSNTNLLIEPAAAVLLLAAPPLLGREARASRLSAALASLALLGQAALLCEPARFEEARRDARGDAGPLGRVVERLRVRGEVLAEEPGLALAAGKPALIEPFQFVLLARSGLWDQRPLLADIERGRFAVIVLGDRLRAMPGLEAALATGYVLEERVDIWEIWRPRAGAGSGG